MRLDKFIASASDYSRSEVKQFIKNKNVRINNIIATNPAKQVNENDCVHLFEQRISLASPRYFMLHKPLGYVCATHDSDHQTVLDLIDAPHKEDLQIAGRLDKDTTGLVLITDDGQWNHKVTSPRKQCFKTYHVTLAESISEDAIRHLEQGVQLKNEKQLTLPAKVRAIDEHTIALTIQEGKYHQVKRMLAAVGNHVKALHRHQIGNIRLDPQLKEGEYRLLTTTEVQTIE